MPRIFDMVEKTLADEEEDDLLDWISEGEGEDLDELEAPIRMDKTFPTSLFIWGMPVVGKDKYDRLNGVIEKLLNKYGPNEKIMPLNEETEKTDGFVVVNYETQESCEKAMTTMNGMSLDKNHQFKVIRMDDFESITARPDEFHAERTLSNFCREDFRDWLLDKKFREQFLLRYQQETEIYWHDTLAGQPVLCYGGQREKMGKKIWCDWRVQWSPAGSYLATFHKPGIALWAGPSEDDELGCPAFKKVVRLLVDQVQYIEFSPNEDYLLTWNGTHPSANDESAVRIFRVLTGECMKKMRTPVMSPRGGEFPHFLWSHDSKYFAECSETSITVRDTETFEIVKDEEGKKTRLKYDALATFQWSPKENLLAVWTLEKDNNPARLVLVEIPSRRELASRSRTQVEATMHWQSEGEFLCLLVVKMSKTGKKIATNLEIFRIKERNIPVDIVEVSKDNVRGSKVYWENRGNRFAVITEDDAGTSKLLIFQMSKEKCENICAQSLPSNSFNHVYWAPDGQYFVVAGLGHGDLLFGGITADNKMEVSRKDEHFMLTDVLWDPSGRYVITAVTQPMTNEMGGFKYSMEAGYAIWTFQGRLMYRQQKEKLWQVSWRPHPPSLLDGKKEGEIRKNIKQFSKKYDALDESAKDSARRAFRAEHEEKNNAFQVVLNRMSEWKKEMDEELGWEAALEALNEEIGWETLEDNIETEIGVSEEVISQ